MTTASRGGERVVMVTGANSAIGLAITAAVLERGARVVATVRSDEAAATVRRSFVPELAAGQLVLEHLDVTDAAGCELVLRRHEPQVVVNNAGSALLGAVCDIDDESARHQLEVMVVAPVRLARLLVAGVGPHGCEPSPPDRRVVNVSSSLTTTPVPFTGWYAASKAAMDTISERLRVELAPSGVRVLTVECGAVATAAWDDAADDVLQGATDADGTAAGRRRWARLTSWLEPRYADPAEVGEVVAAAALDPRPAPVRRVGFGASLGRVAPLVPAPLRDVVGRTVFRLGRPR